MSRKPLLPIVTVLAVLSGCSSTPATPPSAPPASPPETESVAASELVTNNAPVAVLDSTEVPLPITDSSPDVDPVSEAVKAAALSQAAAGDPELEEGLKTGGLLGLWEGISDPELYTQLVASAAFDLVLQDAQADFFAGSAGEIPESVRSALTERAVKMGLSAQDAAILVNNQIAAMELTKRCYTFDSDMPANWTCKTEYPGFEPGFPGALPVPSISSVFSDVYDLDLATDGSLPPELTEQASAEIESRRIEAIKNEFGYSPQGASQLYNLAMNSIGGSGRYFQLSWIGD